MSLLEVHPYRLPPDHGRALGLVQQFMDMVVGNLQRLLQLKTIDGVLLERLALGATAARFVHGLGRAPQGFIVARLNANAAVFEVASDASSITLQASATCVANIWIY